MLLGEFNFSEKARVYLSFVLKGEDGGSVDDTQRQSNR